MDEKEKRRILLDILHANNAHLREDHELFTRINDLYIDYRQYANMEYYDMCNKKPDPDCKYLHSGRMDLIYRLEEYKKIVVQHIMNSARVMSVEEFEKLLLEQMKGLSWGHFQSNTSYKVVCLIIKRLRHNTIKLLDLVRGYYLLQNLENEYQNDSISGGVYIDGIHLRVQNDENCL